MKNLTKLFLLPTCFLALMATAKPVLALSGEDVQLAEFNKISVSEVVDYNDASLIKVTYVVVSAGNASEPQTATSYLQCYWFEK
jgi:hypothetical protein